jgi:dCMP deaminase
MIIPYKIELDEEIVKKSKERNVEVLRDGWHEYFILQAYLVSTRSLDAQTKFGCVIVDDSKNIISTGYNGFVRGIDNGALPNIRPENDTDESKYPYMIHSEHNAILSGGLRCRGASLYVTGKPCITCLQYMYQAGIKKIYYSNIDSPKMCDGDQYKKRFDFLYYLMADNLEINIIESESLNKKIRALKEIFA